MDTIAFDNISVGQFPMLYAFKVLNASLSHMWQSAPICTSEYTAEQWEGIEAILRFVPSHEFVAMALATDVGDQLFERHFPKWGADWV